MATETASQAEFGQQPNAITPLTAHTVDNQPPLELTLEQKTPIVRWVIITVLGIVVFSILTYWINADNPKIDATALAAIAAGGSNCYAGSKRSRICCQCGSLSARSHTSEHNGHLYYYYFTERAAGAGRESGDFPG